MALYTLAVDYFMTGQYADSTTAYAKLLADYASEFNEVANGKALKTTATRLSCWVAELRSRLLARAASECSSATVPSERSTYHCEWAERPNGGCSIGANVSTITQSTAKRLGLSVSKAQAHTQSGATGSEVALSAAIIPAITFGDAVIRNVAVLVMDDKDLQIDVGEKKPYQIEGILGYPVLAMLGSFRVSGNEMTVGGDGGPSSRSTQLYSDQLTPLLVARLSGQQLLFQFDTGNTGAELTRRNSRTDSRSSSRRSKARWHNCGAPVECAGCPSIICPR